MCSVFSKHTLKMYGTALIYTEICVCVCVSVCLCIFSPHLFSTAGHLRGLTGTTVALKHPFSRSETACICPVGVCLKTRGEKRSLTSCPWYSEAKKNRCYLWNCVGKREKLGIFLRVKVWRVKVCKLITAQETPFKRTEIILYCLSTFYFFLLPPTPNQPTNQQNSNEPTNKNNLRFFSIYFSIRTYFSLLLMCNTAFLNHWLWVEGGSTSGCPEGKKRNRQSIVIACRALLAALNISRTLRGRIQKQGTAGEKSGWI